jgi:hypothetical protein
MARGPAQLVVAIVPLAATPPTLTWRIVSGWRYTRLSAMIAASWGSAVWLMSAIVR